MKTHRLIVMGAVLVGVAISLGSCGVYTFNPAGKSTIKSIAIEPFENKTVQLGLEDQMTTDVINAFISDGKLKVLPADNAEAILHGTLVRYDRRPYEYTGGEQVQSYAVTMDFDITLTQADGTELWTQRMSQTGIYDLNTQTEEDGQRLALGRLVEAIINQTTKSW